LLPPTPLREPFLGFEVVAAENPQNTPLLVFVPP
jgi:hypothetical protein